MENLKVLLKHDEIYQFVQSFLSVNFEYIQHLFQVFLL